MNIARPSGAHVISKQPGIPWMPFDAQIWSELTADEILDEALDGSPEGVALFGRKGSNVA